MKLAHSRVRFPAKTIVVGIRAPNDVLTIAFVEVVSVFNNFPPVLPTAPALSWFS